ncbi:hypothetical protein PS893_03689 [Pseudomonas fluorescens]|jgi:hypothetical protein|uniref:GIY-YIG nuclease family protein n=1 Tax=Pseudomonas fluorescens TaxID=294 RepID=UPI001254EC56|nr:GIY-YIG nuclease family protein [Pseudomonas fluorescens]VVP18264.1 hypothetical protein PS893_03689 [Pseudomonas fluorescens]
MGQDFTALYRHFDAEKRLLYVGISLSASRRLSQHMRDSKWARTITSIEIEHFETRSQAVEAEQRAIVDEKPLWNVLHNLAEAAQSSPASIGNTRKLRPEEVMFDYGNVARNIVTTGAKVEQILELVTEARIDGLLETDRFISLRLKMHEGLVAEDVGLEELFNLRAPRPTPSSAFLMVTGVSAFEPGQVVDQAEITLITPKGLADSCREFLKRSERYAAVYQSEVLPAIHQFKNAYLKIEKLKSSNFL